MGVVFQRRLQKQIATLLTVGLFAFSSVLASAQPAADATVQTPLSVLVFSAESKRGAQDEIRQAWRKVVDTASVSNIPQILEAMKGAGPTTENWLRAAVDAIAEREKASLSAADLENFILNAQQSPRARRVAYEWLTQIDDAASRRLLLGMFDDQSLELRYDALAMKLEEAKSLEDEKLKLKAYQLVLRSARDKGQLRECAEALKELGQTPNMAKEMGFLTTWQVIGPFDNTDRAGYEKALPPETAVDLAGAYEGKSGEVKWKQAVAEQEDLDLIGIVDLNAALVEEKSVLAYAVTTFVAAQEREVECRYQSKEATKLWVNGEEVAANNVYHSGGGFDQYIVKCKFKKGENQILIKVCQNEQTQPWTKPWDFRLRVTDELGGAVQPVK